MKGVVEIVLTAGMPGGRSRSRVATVRRRVITVSLFTLVAAGLFALYLRVSRTYPENSDEANILLMAWDMLHGHVNLHGWAMSDVSFYTTELSQYALLESFLGLHSDTAHVGAAMTYTLVVLLAAILAQGKQRARGVEARQGGYQGQADRGAGIASMLLAAGILIAPQLGVGVFILLLSVGHIGTAVPLMLTWLVIDRGNRRPREAVAVCLLLAWTLVADPLVLVTGIVPLAVVCVVRIWRAWPAVARDVGRTAWRRALLRARGYEIALLVASLAAWGLATCTEGLMHYNGGYRVHSVCYHFVSPALWPGQAWVTIQGWLAMFGAWPWGSAADIFFSVMHMAGVGLVAWAMWRVARRFLRYPSLVDQVLLVSIVVNVALYIPSTLGSTTDLNAREYAVALPFGAVLAGRTLGPSIRLSTRKRAVWAYGVLRASRVRLTVPALLAVSGCYLASLGYTAAQPSAPAANEQLATWLAAHNLTYGISGYWQSSIVTLDSQGQVTIRAVYPGNLKRDWWESKRSWYSPGLHTATFLVTENQPGFYNNWQPDPGALAAFGQPSATYTVGPYTVFVFPQNLLAGVG